MSGPEEATPVLFADMSEDLLQEILLHLDMISMAKIAQASRTLSRICQSDDLWQHHVCKTWMQLPARVVTHVVGSGWRELARSRAEVPRSWQLQCGYMDEIESILNAAPPSLEHLDRFASLVIAIFSSPEAIISPAGCELLAAMRHAIASDATLQALHAWGTSLQQTLDQIYYEEGAEDSSVDGRLTRRKALVDAMRGASALTFLHDEVVAKAAVSVGAVTIVGDDHGEDTPPIRRAWAQHGLDAVVNGLPELLASLEEEGFNITVPPHFHPPRALPRTHVWWGARAPVVNADRC